MPFAPFSSRALGRAAGLVLLIASASFPAGAQLTAASIPAESGTPGRPTASVPGTRFEYGLYVGEGLGGRRTFATGTSTVAGKNWRQFADRLGTKPFPEYPSTEPAFFNWLADQGWDLVGCERNEEIVGLLGDRDTVTRCYFRRVAGPPADVAPADSSRGSTSSLGAPNDPRRG